MSLVVNTNVGSLNAQRSLASSGAELKTAMERLSSGKKINSAADDAAGFAIAERMTAQIRGLNMAVKNANDGLSMLAVMEHSVNDATEIIQRMRELAVQALNDINSPKDKEYLQAEFTSLVDEINRLQEATTFNEQELMSSQIFTLQTGTESGQTTEFRTFSTEAKFLGNTYAKIESVTDIGAGRYEVRLSEQTGLFQAWDVFAYGSPWTGYQGQVLQASDIAIDANGVQTLSLALSQTQLDVLTDSRTFGFNSTVFDPITSTLSDGPRDSLATMDLSQNAAEALRRIDVALDQTVGMSSYFGSIQNRLGYTVSNLMNVAEFTTSARSRIEDADFAAESARLAKAQVLQQTGTAMLAQANAQPQLALSLIR